MENKRSSYLVFITFVATLGGLLFGFDMAVISGVLPFVQKQFTLTAAEEGWFVSCAIVGCIIGVLFSGELSDRWGRKKLLIIAAILFLLSALGTALASSLTFLIIARMIGGMGVGVASNLAPLYISEIAPAAIRGRLVTFYQLAVTLGILVAYLTNAAVLAYSQEHQGQSLGGLLDYIVLQEVWRSMFAIGVIPSLLFLLGLFFVPDSPRWLIQKGREEEGLTILTKINGQAVAQQDVVNIRRTLHHETGSYKELFAPGMRKALWIGLLLPLFSQFSGINAVIYYGPRILNDAGISIDNALLSQIILGAANLLFTLIAVWKVDQMGRRPLYLVGALGATISLFLTGLCFYTDNTDNLFLLLSVIAFLACFAFSIGPLKFVIAAEIFPNKIRGRALAISIMTMWIADTVVGQLTPILLESVGTAITFWVFAGCCLLSFWVVYKLVPETKGKTLEEIEDMYLAPH
ncbi:sugar porter family MFS transporter [Rhodocytophaga aerolata]|uniref:Sugar porter family MFS transporter n=1 Tax=Rhodocytophaga aerolata TaxID=455078 RepID=A0ABT8R2W7_9BACT|nr:sugar porter family MFS transporter [Rhodocytophaga aerolata]MDO1446433.1 sugar porter family MFS transporter [Rhodocytophaga aerolata]